MSAFILTQCVCGGGGGEGQYMSAFILIQCVCVCVEWGGGGVITVC